MYDKIYELVRTPVEERMDKILSWCNGSIDEIGNIIIKGTNDFYFSAHYDVVNEYNANDNSASVINLLALKKLRPEINVVFTNYEEPPALGKGAEHFAKNNQGIKYILNLELTGYGRKVVVNGDELGILDKFKKVSMPMSDSNTFNNNGIPSNTIVTTPRKYWGYCHTEFDTLDKINIDDMKWFVENILYNFNV